MSVVEYAEKHLKKEYEELKALFVLHNSGTRKSKKVLDRINELVMDIGLKYQISKFADYRELPFKIIESTNKMEEFKRDTKYGCGLWIGNLIDKIYNI